MGPLRNAGTRPRGGGLSEARGEPFEVLERAGTPEELLTGAYRSLAAATAVVCRPASPALVLGSTQRASSFDVDRCAAAGLEIVRRRSGGGAVVVRPGSQIWVDIFVPRDDKRFDVDVLASFGFVGEAWRSAILDSVASLSPSSVGVRRGAAVPTPWSATLCFGGLGAGEVSIDGQKVVGVAQRRDRRGAWFHSMALLEFDPYELAVLLDAPESTRREAAAWLTGSAATVPGGIDVAAALTAAIVGRLT